MKDYNWKKLGLIYEAGCNNPLLLTHASNPVAVNLNDDIYRIYYSGRDSRNRSSVSYLDINIETLDIISDEKRVVLKFGSEDSFYSHGVTIGDYWTQGGKKYMGFMGWQHRGDEHWRGDIGKFDLEDYSVSKVLGINDVDKISLSYPCVIKEGEEYKMWYGSTISWDSDSIDQEMIHTINYATSQEGIKWNPQGVAIPWRLNEAQAFSKPTIIRDSSGYRMWYSYRKGDGSKYKIGYSYSKDGIVWDRQESNLKSSLIGWDSEMVCYPYVFLHKGKTYMLYNGNRFGKYGFGLAISENKEEK